MLLWYAKLNPLIEKLPDLHTFITIKIPKKNIKPDHSYPFLLVLVPWPNRKSNQKIHGFFWNLSTPAGVTSPGVQNKPRCKFLQGDFSKMMASCVTCKTRRCAGMKMEPCCGKTTSTEGRPAKEWRDGATEEPSDFQNFVKKQGCWTVGLGFGLSSLLSFRLSVWLWVGFGLSCFKFGEFGWIWFGMPWYLEIGGAEKQGKEPLIRL